jgi:hypothetical protein
VENSRSIPAVLRRRCFVDVVAGSEVVEEEVVHSLEQEVVDYLEEEEVVVDSVGAEPVGAE